MATSSEVKAGLDEISAMIKSSRQRLVSSKAMITTQETNLNSIPTRFADILGTVNAYVGGDVFEELCKAELGKMTTEFLALVADASLAVTDLGNRTEF